MPGLGYPGQGPPSNWWEIKAKTLAGLKEGTANITSAGSLSKLKLQEADIWAIQEHKLTEPQKTHRVQAELSQEGWRSYFPTAALTSKGALSGGVVFIWRHYLDVAGPPPVALTIDRKVRCH